MAHIVSDRMMINVSTELGRTIKGRGRDLFKVISQQKLGGAERNHITSGQPISVQRIEPEHEAELLHIRPRRSFTSVFPCQS